MPTVRSARSDRLRPCRHMPTPADRDPSRTPPAPARQDPAPTPRSAPAPPHEPERPPAPNAIRAPTAPRPTRERPRHTAPHRRTGAARHGAAPDGGRGPRRGRARAATARPPGRPLEHPDPDARPRRRPSRTCCAAGQGEHLAAPDDGTLRIPLPASGTACSSRPLLVPHRMAPLRPARSSRRPHGRRRSPTPSTLAALLAQESPRTTAPGSRPAARPTTAVTWSPGSPTRFGAPPCSSPTAGTTPADAPDLFLAAEQSLLLGHPLHPTPKSREGLSEGEARPTRPSCAAPSRCTGWRSPPRVLAPDSAWTERGRPVPRRPLTAASPGPGCPCPTATPPCRCTPGRCASSGTAPRSRPCSTPDCSATSARTAPPGTPPPPSAPSTGPAPRPCSSCPWACASPTPAGRTSARNSTAASRSTACCAAACPSSGRPHTPASTSSATRPGSPSTPRTATR